MSALLSWTVSTLLIAGLLACLGCLATRRQRPALGHALLLLALLKLLMPPLIGIELWSESDAVVPPAETTVMTANAAGVHGPASVPSASPAVTAKTVTTAASWSWSAWLVAAWAMGTAIALLVLALGALRLGRRVLRLRTASVVVQELAQRLGRELGLRRVPPVLVVDAHVSPMVAPTPRGLRLVLPARLLATLSPHALEALLVHELAHVKRRDWLVRFAELLAVAVWWWCPPVHLVRRELHRAEELACDAWVAERPGAARESYAAVLVQAADHACPAIASGIGPVRRLEERLEWLQREPVGKAFGVRGWLTVLGLAALSLPFVACQAPTRLVLTKTGAAATSVRVMGAVARHDVTVPKDGLKILELLPRLGVAPDADLTRVHLIKSSDQGFDQKPPKGQPIETTHSSTPIWIRLDVRQMILTGNVRYNLPVHAGDVVYIPTKSEPNPKIDYVGWPTGPAALANKRLIERGDLVCCLIDDAVVKMPGAERLAFLREFQRIGKDGTILVPYVGPIVAAGKTTKQLEEEIGKGLDVLFNVQIRPQVRAVEATAGPRVGVDPGGPPTFRVRDRVVFLIDPTVLAQKKKGLERLGLLGQLQGVAIDGTILVPYVGPMMVTGLTEREVSSLVTDRLTKHLGVETKVKAKIVPKAATKR